MRAIFKTFAIAAVLCVLAACHGEPADPGNNGKPDVPETPDTPEIPADGFITATIAPLTKVSYSEDSKNHDFVGSWQVGDEIFGFTSEGTAVSFEVESLNPVTKVATLEQKTSVDLAEGTKVHAIFCPGKTADDLSGQSLALDFSEQTVDVLPILLLATATVEKSGLAFGFKSAVSVIGITNPVFPKETTADKLVRITVSGHEIVSSGVVSVSDGQLVFTGNAPDKFIIKTLNVAPVVSSGRFTLEDPVYIVVPAGPVGSVSAIDNRNNFFVYELDKAVEASEYCLLNDTTFPAVALPSSSKVTVENVVWAAANLGAASKTDMGDIYRWSDTGIIYTEKGSGTTATYDENHQDGFNTYDGECYFSASASAYTKYNTTDNKTVLDPVDDIVQLTYPGSDWRMPTLAEFNALFEASDITQTYSTGTGNNAGTTFTQGENTMFIRGTTRVCAPSSSEKKKLGKLGRYWTSSISIANLKSTGGNPDYIQFNTDGTKSAAPTVSNAYRHSGFSIRPVK